MKIDRVRWMAMAMCGALSLGAAARADEPDHRFYVNAMGTGILSDNNRGSRYGYGAQVSIGKRITNAIDLELITTYADFKTRKEDFNNTPQPEWSHQFGAGVGANIYLAPSSDDFLKGLFLHLDVQRGQAHRTPGTIRAYTSTLFDGGVGYNLVLTKSSFGPFAPGIALTFEALYRLDSHNQDRLANTSDENRKYFQEGILNVGFRFPLGGRPQPVAAPPPEAPAEVVPATPEAAPEVAPPPPPPPPPPPCQAPAPGQPISLDGCKLGDTIVLRGVNFEFDKAKLTVNAKTLLDQVGDALLARKDIKVEIDGHTDGKGSAHYNQRLSDRRAKSVKQYLVGRGIDADRMTTKGFGKSMPIATNKTDEGRELNRRVELKVTESGDGSAATAPSDAAPASTPPADTGAAPSGDSSTSAPAAAPADSGASTPPADSSTPPADTSSSTPPADASSSTPPADASPTPSADTSSTPPADASSSTPPSDGSTPPPASSSPPPQ